MRHHAATHAFILALLVVAACDDSTITSSTAGGTSESGGASKAPANGAVSSTTSGGSDGSSVAPAGASESNGSVMGPLTTNAKPRGIWQAPPDAGPSAVDDAGPVGCGTGAGSVDQEQLASDGNIVISPTQSPGQTFTLADTGILTGIEVGLASCNGSDPSASIVLTVSRGGSPIATASMSVADVPTSPCGGVPLTEGVVGAGFFDLSASCVSVTAGDVLTATFTISGSSGTCVSGMCVGGTGSWCMEDEECAYAGRLGMTGDDYAGGGMVVNGSSTTQWDAAFKAFVR